MFLGAYWSSRREPESQARARLTAFFGALAARRGALAAWYPKGGKPGTSTGPPVQMSHASAVSAQMTRNRRDSDGSPMPELGWRIALWNGHAISFSACVGAYAPSQTNSVVISFAPGSTEPAQREQEEVLQLMIDHFDPDHAVATSNELLDRQGASLPWEAGWLRYMRGGRIRSQFAERG